MKLIIIIALFFCNSTFAQNKTFTNSGKTYEIMEFGKTFTVDSCLNIEKSNPGWTIPDTSQLRSIHNQVSTAGLKFLSSTKYEGDNYIQVDMYDPIKMFLAPSENINSAAYYSLILVKEK